MLLLLLLMMMVVVLRWVAGEGAGGGWGRPFRREEGARVGGEGRRRWHGGRVPAQEFQAGVTRSRHSTGVTG